MSKLKINLPIIVEGKYDRIRLLEVVDGVVLTTDGFGVFRKSDLVSYLRRLAMQDKIIILTDSDSGGGQIRGYFRQILPADSMIHLYTPPGRGRSERKGLDNVSLGVEDADVENLRNLLAPFAGDVQPRETFTRADLYGWGLSGHPDSAARRIYLLTALQLPTTLTANALVQALSLLSTREQVESLLEQRSNSQSHS